MKTSLLLAALACMATSSIAGNVVNDVVGNVTTAKVGKELWLFGGGEPICSSVEPEYCQPASRAAAEQHFVATQAFRHKQFQLSASAIRDLQALDGWPAALERKTRVLATLNQLLAAAPAKSWPEASWLEQLAVLDLSDDEQNLLDDWFEQRPVLADGSTAPMQVYYPGVAPFVRDMFEALLASAKARSGRPGKPRLVLLTASSNDPLQWVDYYLQLFTAAGADASWLPLEPAMLQSGLTAPAMCEQLNQQRFIHNGQYNRNARYPELAAYQHQLCLAPERMTALLQQADVVFINGGDQSLTLRSLQRPAGEFSPLGQLLLQKVAAGMPLAGSSAGTAVQSGRLQGKAIPMLSGGGTRKALQLGAFADVPDAPLCSLHQRCTSTAPAGALTYQANGGLRSFSLGVVDTHFRERQREGRLTRLLVDTGTAFGFGVDEATVLRANFFADDGADIQVMGQGGVWLLDSRQATRQRTAVVAPATAESGAPGQHSSGPIWQVQGLVASRLLAGDQIRWPVASSNAAPVKAQLACQQQLPASQVDPDTYAAVDERRWLRDDQMVTACQRADGRWRYLHLPLTLAVMPAPATDD